MAITTLEGAISQLKACRDDHQTLVRQRRVNARAELDEATKQVAIIKDADVEAVTYLRALADAVGTAPALKSYINQQLAYHTQIKADRAAEA